MSHTFRSERGNFPVCFEIFSVLTNFDIVYCQTALRKEDKEFYIGLINKMKMEAKNTIQKAKEKIISPYLGRISQVNTSKTLVQRKMKLVKLATCRILTDSDDSPEFPNEILRIKPSYF
jgi:hypothetical protein